MKSKFICCYLEELIEVMAGDYEVIEVKGECELKYIVEE